MNKQIIDISFLFLVKKKYYRQFHKFISSFFFHVNKH